MGKFSTTLVRPPTTSTYAVEDFTISRAAGGTPLFFRLLGRSRVCFTLGFNNFPTNSPPVIIRVDGRATEQAGWDQLGELVQIPGGTGDKLIHFDGVAVEAIQINYVSGGNPNTRIVRFSARAEGR